jgi:hypothetical protein
MKKNVLIAFIISLGLLSQAAWAGGLKLNNYGEVLVQNLQIGSHYSMIELVNLPLEVANQSDEAITIQIEVEKPALAKRGFEPIPDAAWVNITPAKAEIPAQGTYKTDVTVSVPNDPRYLGKKYQANIRARMLPKVKGVLTIALAVQGRFLFTIAAVQKTAPASSSKVNMNFDFLPARVDMKNLVLGKKAEVLNAKGEPVYIANQGDKEIKLVLQSLDLKDTVLSPEPGFTAAPNADFLTFAQDELVMGPAQKKPLKMFVEIPAKSEYAGKQYEFIVSAKTGEAMTGDRYLRVMIFTAK